MPIERDVTRPCPPVACRSVVAITAVVVAMFSVLAAISVWRGWLNADEGFYAGAARAVMQGRLPYRDFAYPQMPLLPYVNGPILSLTGFGLVPQRTLNAVWAGLAVVLVAAWVSRHGRRWPALATGLALAAAPAWVQCNALGKPYAAAGLFVTLAAAAALSQRGYTGRVVLYAVSGALAVGCRLTVAPMTGALGLVLGMQAPEGRQRWLPLTACAALGAALVVPFAWEAPESFRFWNFEYHTATSFDRRGWSSLAEHALLAPGVLMLALAGLAAAGRRSVPAAVVAAGWLAVAVESALPSTYGTNSAPYMGAMALGAGLLVSSTGRRGDWLAGGCLAATLVAAPFSNWDLWHPLPGHYAAARNALRQVEPGPVISALPILTMDAGREVLARLETAPFAVTCELDAAKAQRLHLMTGEELVDHVRAADAAAVVLWNGPNPWNFRWSVPSLQPLPPETFATLMQALSDSYVPVHAGAIAVLARRPVSAAERGSPPPPAARTVSEHTRNQPALALERGQGK